MKNRKRRLGPTPLILAALSLAVAAASLSESVSGEDEPSRTKWRIFVTGDTKGYLRPCGCAAGLKGGYPRRATYLAGIRRDGDLLVDLGNIVEGTRPQDRVRLRYVLKGLKLLGYDAMVPGQGELAYGEDFEKLVRSTGPRTICANLFFKNGNRPFPRWHIHKTPSGEGVAVVGLTSPYQKIPGRYRITKPTDALRDAIKVLKRKGLTKIVVAGYLKGKPALDLAKDFPDVVLVAGGFVPRGTKEPLRRGGAPVVLAGERGQYVGSAELRGSSVTGGGQTWLGEDVPDDKTLARLVQDHDDEVSSMGSAYKAGQLLAFRKKGWVGSESCRACHKTEYESWAESKHAHAMQALKAKKQDRNPNCLECHYQDVPEQDGHRLREVRGVGCESCHGGGEDHVQARREKRQSPPMPAPVSCAGCHDKQNSPGFERTSYWDRMRHGKD